MVRLYSITGIRNGLVIFANCKRNAKKLFRKFYPTDKIIHAKLTGTFNPKFII